MADYWSDIRGKINKSNLETTRFKLEKKRFIQMNQVNRFQMTPIFFPMTPKNVQQ